MNRLSFMSEFLFSFLNRKALLVQCGANFRSSEPSTRFLVAQETERVAKMTAALDMWKASVEKSLAGEDYGQPRLPPPDLKR